MMTRSIDPSKRRPGRPKQSEAADKQTESVILRKASELFMQIGYERVSLVQIADACGVTKATVYYYFGNKAKLFTRAVVQLFDIVCGHVDRMMSADRPLSERLRDVAAAQMANAHLEFESMMKEASLQLTDEQIREIRDAEIRVHSRMAASFTAAVERGELRQEEPMLLSFAFASLVAVGKSEYILDLYDGDVKQAAAHVVDLFYYGAGAGRADGSDA